MTGVKEKLPLEIDWYGMKVVVGFQCRNKFITRKRLEKRMKDKDDI